MHSRTALNSKVRGWEALVAELRRVRDAHRAEAARLLGPDRGE
jgi:hypothetical protein